MNFIESIKQRARKNIKTIVLPESSDVRVIKAAEIATKEKYAKKESKNADLCRQL